MYINIVRIHVYNVIILSTLQVSNITKNGHNFQLTTYKTRTVCDLCGKMLWGVVFHGYQCSLCEINIHRYHCIGEVTAECAGKKNRLRKFSQHKKANCKSLPTKKYM